MPKAKAKHEQANLADLEDWEEIEPNVSFDLVDGKLVERPVPRAANVATPKKRRQLKHHG